MEQANRTEHPENILVQREGPHATLLLLSPINDILSDSLKTLIFSLIDDNVTTLHIDMERINRLHTPALGTIVAAHRRLQQKSGCLSLIHVSSELYKLFTTFELQRVLNINTL